MVSELMLPSFKICNTCDIPLRTNEFYTRKEAKDGLRNQCKRCICRRQGKWTISNQEKYRVYNKQYVQTESGRKNRNRAIRKYYKTESYNQAQRKYLASPKGKAKAIRGDHKHRARLKQTEATLTAQEWRDIQRQYNFRCCYCGKEKKLTRDHVLPLSKGGSLTKENIVPACQSCNSKKGVKYVAQFIQTSNQ